MDDIGTLVLRQFLTEVARRHSQPARLLLVGGSALCLLGRSRPTLDVDYAGSDVTHDDLQKVMDAVARDMQIVVEAVPIDRFIPIPAGAEERHVFLDRFDQLDVYAFDPYSISLSKIDRGFDTDIDDVVFLIHRQLVDPELLATIIQQSLMRAAEFDMIPADVNAHMNAVYRRLAEA